MNDKQDTIIEFKGVCKSFGSLLVLDGIDLSIERGKTTVVLGESGTGKSVLLKHIVGLLKPDKGRVFVEGRDITLLSERSMSKIRINFGFLFQSGALFDSMTAAENVGFPLREHTQKSNEEILEIVEEKLRLVGLEKFGSRMPSQLSGGQKKRVALARAIAMNPKVILYDEPTTGLDPIRADIIDELILKMKEHLKVTSIVVTHDMKSAFKVGDRLLMLANGKFIFDGTADEIRQSSDPRVMRFIAGHADPKELEALEME
jgi:phospholipid/cholesterol/gamma-HCH transport system ATP-binding protein